MKKCLALIVTLLLCCTLMGIALAEDSGYSYLDDMSLSELEALKTEVEKRIEAAKAADASNPENLGMWEIRYYVDEFGNPTSKGYITNTYYIKGKFSNSATTNSALNVVFLIDGDGVAIKLYEYAGKSPVKAYSNTSYSVTIQDKNGSKSKFSATEYKNGDRLWLDSTGKNLVLKALREHGQLSFAIQEDKYSMNKYVFTITDTSYFANAEKKLLGN